MVRPVKPNSQVQNTQFSSNKEIPIVLRNKETGWPLIQIGFFTFDQDKQMYTNLLGGGKCHHMNLPVYGLALLLANIPTKKEINNSQKSNPEKLFNIWDAKEGYRINLPMFGIEIEESHSGWGSMAKISLNEGLFETKNDCDELNNKLCNQNVFNKFIEDTLDIGLWEDTYYSRQHLEKNIDPTLSIFFEGQVYTDLGEFFKKVGVSDDILSYFEDMFKVNQCKELLSTISEDKEIFLDGISEEEAIKIRTEAQILRNQEKINQEKKSSKDSIGERNSLHNQFFKKAKENPQETNENRKMYLLELQNVKNEFKKEFNYYIENLNKQIDDIDKKYSATFGFTMDNAVIGKKYPEFLLKKSKVFICQEIVAKLQINDETSLNKIIEDIEKEYPEKFKDFMKGAFSNCASLVKKMNNKQQKLNQIEKNLVFRISNWE